MGQTQTKGKDCRNSKHQQIVEQASRCSPVPVIPKLLYYWHRKMSSYKDSIEFSLLSANKRAVGFILA